MLRQIEGSRAVAEAVARCRPEVVCAYPISPQTHIIEALGVMVKTGELDPCEFVNVESEFAAMSVALGASAAGARAYTATASQGLLFMMEAVYNVAGLGLAGGHDHRQPGHRRTHQHLERPQRRHGRARRGLGHALRRDQPGGRRPPRPGLPAGRGGVGPGHGVHGRLHPDPRRRGGRPRRPGGRRRLPPALRAPPGPRPRRPRCRSGPWSAPTPSPRCGTWPTRASSRRCGPIPEIVAEFAAAFGRRSGGLVRPYRQRRRRDRRGGHGLDPRHHQGRRRRLRAEGIVGRRRWG